MICYPGENPTAKERTPMKIYTIEEAAEALKVKPATIKIWLQKGILKGTRLTHKVWRITEEQLQASMKAREGELPEASTK
jgi:excisionase family DNA binding protein